MVRDMKPGAVIVDLAALGGGNCTLTKNNEIVGFCFTPQDGNSILSSLAITEWFLYPNSYEEKIQCLKDLFFDEV